MAARSHRRVFLGRAGAAGFPSTAAVSGSCRLGRHLGVRHLAHARASRPAMSRSSRTCRVHHDVGAECGHHSADRLVDHSRASRGVAYLS